MEEEVKGNGWADAGSALPTLGTVTDADAALLADLVGKGSLLH